MKQRITRAKARVAKAQVPFEAPSAIERSERLAAVAAMIYLVFNEGYTAGSAELGSRGALCEEAIRLGRLLLRLFPAEPEIMALIALLLLQHSRLRARFDATGALVVLEAQDRQLWDKKLIAGGLALIKRPCGTAGPVPIRSRRQSRPCMPARNGHRIPTGTRSISCTVHLNACSPHPW